MKNGDQMDKSELVSIIVPVYNIENYISKCIDSLLSQTYKEIEIILIDDGSTDGSGMICDNYKELDSRIVVIHQENMGLVLARKSGLSVANGTYLSVVDGDDWVESRFIETLMLEMSSDTDFVQCAVWFDYGDYQRKQLLKCGSEINIEEYTRNGIYESYLKGSPIIESYIWNKIYRRTLFEQVYSLVPNDMSIGEDFVCYLFMLTKVKKIKSVNIPLYIYRVRQDSMSHDDDINYLIQHDNLTNYMITKAKELGISAGLVAEKQWFIRRKIEVLKRISPDLKALLNSFYLGDIRTLRNKRVVIYGAGNVGEGVYNQLAREEHIYVVAWVDKQFKKCQKEYYSVREIESLMDIEFDYLVLAIKDKSIADEAKKELVEKYRVNEAKIFWDKPIKKWG